MSNINRAYIEPLKIAIFSLEVCYPDFYRFVVDNLHSQFVESMDNILSQSFRLKSSSFCSPGRLFSFFS